MSPASAICPHCRRTIHHKGALHRCVPIEPPPPGSSPLTYLALALFVVVVGLVGGWALWEWAVSK